MLAICRAISLSRGTQSSFPHIIIRTMCAGNCPPGGTNFRTAETVGSVNRSPSGSSSWGGSGCIGFPPNRPICPLAHLSRRSRLLASKPRSKVYHRDVPPMGFSLKNNTSSQRGKGTAEADAPNFFRMARSASGVCAHTSSSLLSILFLVLGRWARSLCLRGPT
jgi:hypothetical protein